MFYSEDGKELLRKIDQVYGEWDKFDQRVAAAAIVEGPGGKKASPALISVEGKNRINILQGLFQELSAIKGYHASRTVNASEAAFRTEHENARARRVRRHLARPRARISPRHCKERGSARQPRRDVAKRTGGFSGAPI